MLAHRRKQVQDTPGQQGLTHFAMWVFYLAIFSVLFQPEPWSGYGGSMEPVIRDMLESWSLGARSCEVRCVPLQALVCQAFQAGACAPLRPFDHYQNFAPCPGPAQAVHVCRCLMVAVLSCIQA